MKIETEEKITIKATCALDMVDLVEVRGRFTCLHDLCYFKISRFRRIDDGERLCKDLILLVQERANIEKEFAKQLKSWSSKWNSLIEKGKTSRFLGANLRVLKYRGRF